GCRGTPGRQVPAAHRRPPPLGRRHRPGLQAATGGRTRLARHETATRPPTGLPPTRRPHPRPRPALLAGAATGPHRRDPRRHHLDPRPRPAATPPRRHLHRPRRHLPPDHRAHPRGPPPARGPRPGPTPEDPPPRHRTRQLGPYRPDQAQP